jgi:hypothetical protein
MTVLKLPRMRARVVVTLWALFGACGGLIAVLAMLQLAGLPLPLLQHLPLAGASKGAQFFAFVLGVSLACVGLWGIYSKTVHARENVF